MVVDNALQYCVHRMDSRDGSWVVPDHVANTHIEACQTELPRQYGLVPRAVSNPRRGNGCNAQSGLVDWILVRELPSWHTIYEWCLLVRPKKSRLFCSMSIACGLECYRGNTGMEAIGPTRTWLLEDRKRLGPSLQGCDPRHQLVWEEEERMLDIRILLYRMLGIRMLDIRIRIAY